MSNILLFHQGAELIPEISAIARGYNVIAVTPQSDLPALLPDTEIIAGYGGGLPKWVELAGPQLKWVQTWSAGVDALPLAELQKLGVIVTNASGIHGKPIAQSIFAFILSFARGLDIAYKGQIQQAWAPPPDKLSEGIYTQVFELAGTTIGILGAGTIGTETARIAKVFEMNTIGLATTSAPRKYFDKIYTSEDADKLYAESDFVVNILPYTALTRKFVNAASFGQMKKSAVYISVGRGPTTDNDALLKALSRGTIARAGLDVTDPEPLTDGHPMWSAPNLYITPHFAGSTQFYAERAAEIFLENLKAYVAEGKPTRNIVDLSAGY
ncbi:MAG: D-2-hydroxyacid dehydrogenase [Oscillospiraceae bacterium]|jgi:phosphoglycerate dehydrogenase-like enzyme|nr:D-2-hydroxyacid dehydrogenase [Oscillospiraceae bacterium]